MPQPFPSFPHPIVQAPMAGGPSTPALAAAVSNAGGLGFVAAGYKSPGAVRADVEATRTLTARPFGLNLFVPQRTDVDAAAVARYRERLQEEARGLGVTPGEPRADDDGWEAKLALALELRVPVVSFTFGCPSADDLARLHAAGLAAWVTVTEPDEAHAAQRAGADALVVQGVEAGGHRGTFEDADGRGELTTLALLRLVARQVPLPLVAAGGIMDGAGVAAVLAAGARAAQLGTAFLRCPEAATHALHREALAGEGTTALTRAFTGRRARGLVNRFLREHSAEAPAAYPHLHHVTAPLRAASRGANDPGGINLWAGEAYALAEEAPAGELVLRWASEARAALARAQALLEGA